jgi:putative hydrolase
MRIQVDLHVHTVASGHAFSTVMEIAREASMRGLRAVGISDHGPALPGGPHLYHFSALRFLPRMMEGVRILRGVEANLVNDKGGVDIPGETLSRLDYAMVGFHEGCGLRPSSAKKNTRALVAAMETGRIRVITHPENPAFPVDVTVVVRAALDLAVALEINNSSFGQARSGSAEAAPEFAAEAARVGAPVCLSSDAHVACQIGQVDAAWKVASAAGVQPDQVVNRTLEGLTRFLGLEEADLRRRSLTLR